MRITLSRLGLLLSAAALAVLGFTGAATAAPDSAGLSVSDTKQNPASPRPDVTTQAAFNGVCEYYELCMFHGNQFTGSGIDFPVNFGIQFPNYNGHTFISAGAGSGQGVANNARSLFNADPFFYVYGCIDQNFAGMCAYQPPFSGGDLFPDYFLNLESHLYVF